MTKYIFITGGVVSSLGKGIVAASLGRLLKNRGLKVTMQKFDPYINVDPGTMSPYQHGEVYVTNDGTETDLDLGHYERFIDNDLNKYSNVTTGKIYSEVIRRERRGDYNGATVQVIPHITDMIKQKIMRAATTTDSDVIITEVGGTVGDIESLPYLEALRQMKSEVGSENVVYIHTSLVPYLRAAGEMKTKPTQHSVKELRGIGIQPNILVVRTEQEMPQSMKDKIASFCDVDSEAVIESRDAESLYDIPLNLQAQNFDDIVCRYLHLNTKEADMTNWNKLVNRVHNLKHTTKITLVGKYTKLQDAYISVTEALRSAGYVYNTDIELKKISADEITEDNVAELLKDADGILVPGGFGSRGLEGMITTIKYARENDVPYFGICLGMQMASIEFARNVAGISDATTGEVDDNAANKIIDIMADKKDLEDRGGTLRLGAYPCKLKPGSKTAAAYGNQSVIQERHRHRYEFNNDYRKQFEELGLSFSGVSPDNRLVEIIEVPENKFHIAVQYHPEFLSRPTKPEGLFKAFIGAASGLDEENM